MAKKTKRTWVHFFVVGLNILLSCAALIAASLLIYVQNRASSVNRVALQSALTEVDSPKGERVMNILLVGSDSSGTLNPDDPINIGRSGQRLGDVIIIAHIDERTGEMALLSLPRDLWVPLSGTGRSSRINKAFETGGPVMLVETIEDNFGIPIHHYANVDFAGFQGLVESLGSVNVYFESPARDWNEYAKPEPRSQTGFIVNEAGCQSLEPDQALAYVRSRYYQTQSADGAWVLDPTSDLGRIRRQQDFLRRVMQRSIELGARNPFVLSDLIDTGLENVVIDDELTPQLLMDIASTYRGFDPEKLQTYSFPSMDAKVGTRQVLVPESADARSVINLFKGNGFGDPSTVGVHIAAIDNSVSDQEAVLKDLQQAGFLIHEIANEDEEVAFTGAEILIEYGPDGKNAAEVLANKISQPVQLRQIEGLSGRNVKLSFPQTVKVQTENVDAVESSDSVDPVENIDPDESNDAAEEAGEELVPAGPVLGEPTTALSSEAHSVGKAACV